MSRSQRRLVILTEGRTDPVTAKTAACVIRYGTDEVVALLDSTQAGKTSQELLGVGGAIPVVARLDDAPAANTLLIGIAPTGGKIPPAWRPCCSRRSAAGGTSSPGCTISCATIRSLPPRPRSRACGSSTCARTTSATWRRARASARVACGFTRSARIAAAARWWCRVEVARALSKRGHDCKFVATGQTGILIEGDGCPVDRVICDFLNGAVEKLVLANQHHEILVVEGQGFITHPRYSPVTLGLLHGARPQGLILCYEAARPHVMGMPGVKLTPLAELRELYEKIAGALLPTRVIGVGLNSRLLSPDDAERERERVRAELGVPVCDVFRHGPDELVDAVLGLQSELFGKS